jgi:hypothetical protein
MRAGVSHFGPAHARHREVVGQIPAHVLVLVPGRPWTPVEAARRVGQPEIEAIFNPRVAAQLVARPRAARVPAAAERSLADRELWDREALYPQSFDGVDVTQVGSPLRGLS